MGIALGRTAPASAAWSGSGSGSGAGAAAVMPTGTVPHGTVSGTSVTVELVRRDVVERRRRRRLCRQALQRRERDAGDCRRQLQRCRHHHLVQSWRRASQWHVAMQTDTPVEVNWTGGQSADSASVTVP